ncbi:hypothetical protein KKE28_04025, partial [Patescibacteria group bacterium]|nr:hypothetical protein [Patescibacteria group bacterium]
MDIKSLWIMFWAPAVIFLPAIFFISRLKSKLFRGGDIKDALQIDQAGIRTATVTYENTNQRQSVVLFGMIHVGRPDYYEQISNRILAEEQAGHPVLYEQVKPSTPVEEAELSPTERVILEVFRRFSLIQRLMARAVRAEHQMSALAPSNTWVHSDLTVREFGQLLMRGDTAWRFISVVSWLETTASWLSLVPIAGQFISWLIRSVYALLLVVIILIFPPAMRRLRYIILDHRNAIAFQGIVRALAENDRVISIWGAAHLPGIGQL